MTEPNRIEEAVAFLMTDCWAVPDVSPSELLAQAVARVQEQFPALSRREAAQALREAITRIYGPMNDPARP